METIWTKQEHKQEVDQMYADMKQHGFTKADCKREVASVMRDNNIKLQK